MNQEKFMDDLDNKKGNFLCDLTSKTYLQSTQKTSPDVNQVEFSENGSSKKENQCHENISDSFFNDEESMIPKGLLDQPFDKPDEPYYHDVVNPSSNANMLSYGIPCYIAVFPQGNERPVTNYNQLNGTSSYFPSETSYLYPPGNEFIMQNQREVRTFNNPQYTRNYQGLDYNWWGHNRQNQVPYLPNPNLDMRTPNIQRNIGFTIAERIYEPQQIIHDHPYEYQQRDSSYKTHLNYGHDSSFINSNYSQPSYPKNYCKNQSKHRREFQPTQDSAMYFKNPFIQDSPVISNINHIINPTNITLPKHEEINRCSDPEQLMSYLNVYNVKFKTNDLNTFKKIALEGCLQLEKLLAANNNKSSAKSLEDLCRSVKSQLSHSINSIQTELIIRELILGFLHVCNSWICISSILTMKSNQNLPYESNLQALLVDFENWQNTSKTLLEKLLIAVQEISAEHEKFLSEIYKSMSDSKSTQEPEKILNDIDEYKKEILHQDLRQNHAAASPPPKSEEYHAKQNPIQWSESENQFLSQCCEKDENSYTFNGRTIPTELLNNQQTSDCSLNQNAPIENSLKQQKYNNTHGIICSMRPDNINQENNINNQINENKLPHSEKKNVNITLNQTNNSLCKQEIGNYLSPKSRFSFGNDKEIFNEKDVRLKINSPLQPDLVNHENNNSKSESNENSKAGVHPENKCDEEEEKEFNTRTNNDLNQNYQLTHDRYNPKYNRKKSLKNKICNFSKNYSKTPESSIYSERFINVKTYSKSKLQDIFSAIQGADLEKFVTQRISDTDITKIRQSITYPLFSISYSVNKDCYHSLNDVLDDLYKLFFKAKCENKGNITLLTVANRLELKLINMMFEEIGIC